MPSKPETVFVYCVNLPLEGLQDIVSILPDPVAFGRGLPREAVVGKLLKRVADGGTISPDNFARNTVFVEFLHQVIGRFGSSLPGLVAAARNIGDGRVYIIDARTPTPQGNVPAHDVIGAFEVQGGVIVAGSYTRNPNHVILSVNGFWRLDTALHQILVREVSALT